MPATPSKVLASSLAVVAALAHADAQVPAQCFEIESILVDACNPIALCPGSTEGQNEMVRFRVGPAPLAIADLQVTWPNNNFLGFVQNATTASLTAQLNATIEGCGWLLEPAGGLLPAGATVLVVTSTDMCVAGNSFAALGDTLHILFQAAGNTSGHFANHNNGTDIVPAPIGGVSLRTLIMRHVPTACADTVTYDRQFLTNIYGTYGGFSGDNDGATVRFAWPGPPVATYVNNGCLAPYEPILVSVPPPADVLCAGGSVALAGQVSGPVTGVYWQGGSGVFSDPASAGTTYTAGPGDVGTVSLSLCATGTCGAPICTTVDVPVVPPPVVTVTANGPAELCPGASLALLASGADTFVWQPGGATGALLVVGTAGTYTVTGTTACGQGEASITLSALPPTDVVITGNPGFCTGSSTTLTASGADSYVWSTGASGASITVQQGGTYTVTGTGVCGTDVASVQVAEIAAPTVTIGGDTSICTGSSTTLTASGADSYVWNTGASGASITVQQGGTYTVTGANACGSDQAGITVNEVAVSASFIASPMAGSVPLTVFFTNQSTPGNASFAWDFGDGSTATAFAPQHTYTAPGTYAVTLTASFGGCEATAVAYVEAGEPAASESFISVPNVFSPNGDGRNDVLEVIANAISALDMVILNRWGQVVARIERPGQVWDSRSIAGERCPEGSYFYVLRATGQDGRSYDLSGTITLVR